MSDMLLASYEDAVINAMSDYSENPMYPLTELEVFVGDIINKTGGQNHRQRDKSIKLRDEFNRITTEISRMIRHHGASDHKVGEQGGGADGTTGPATRADGASTTAHEDIAMAIACMHVACEPGDQPHLSWRYKTSKNGLESFKIVAAAVLTQVLARAEGMNRMSEEQDVAEDT